MVWYLSSSPGWLGPLGLGLLDIGLLVVVGRAISNQGQNLKMAIFCFDGLLLNVQDRLQDEDGVSMVW